jgi:hypothetical protein
MLRFLPRIPKYSQVTATINFHHLISWLNTANFAHGISQCFNVIHAGLKGFRIWS